MFNKEYSWNVSLPEALLISSDENITIPINEENWADIFTDTKNSEYIVKALKLNQMHFSQFLNNKLNKKYKFDTRISMHPDYNGEYYEIGYDIVEIFKNIFNGLGIDYNIKKFDYNDPYQVDCFNDYIRITLKDTFNMRFTACKFMAHDEEQLLYNIDLFLDYILSYMINTNKTLNTCIKLQKDHEQELRDNKKVLVSDKDTVIIPKNLLLVTAVSALDIFTETGDMDYYKYAKDYNKNIANHKTEWTPIINVNGYRVNNKFDDSIGFNNLFNTIRYNYFDEGSILMDMEEKSNNKKDDILKKGAPDIKIKRTISKTTSRTYDYAKAKDILTRKCNFYKSIKNRCIGLIKGDSKDTDYMGIVLDNNYVILDKLFDYDRNGFKKPAIDNAVYVVSLDVLKYCDKDKKKIRDYIKKNKDYKAFRFYHNDKDSYQDKIKEILDYSDSSTIKYTKNLEI